MADTQESFFPELVDILRRQTADDGFGGATKYDLIEIDTGVPARVTQAQTQAQEVA